MQLISLLLHSMHSTTHALGPLDGDIAVSLSENSVRPTANGKQQQQRPEAHWFNFTLVNGVTRFALSARKQMLDAAHGVCVLACGLWLAHTCTERELLNWHWKLTFRSDQFVKFSFYFRCRFRWNFNAHTIIMSNKRQRIEQKKKRETGSKRFAYSRYHNIQLLCMFFIYRHVSGFVMNMENKHGCVS